MWRRYLLVGLSCTMLAAMGCSDDSSGASDADAGQLDDATIAEDAGSDATAQDVVNDTQPDTAEPGADASDAADSSPEDTSDADDPTDTGPDEPQMWVSAYFASWNHYAPPGGNWGNLPTDEIDWNGFTQLHYFVLTVNADGSLSEIKEWENMNPDRVDAIVQAAHDHNKPVLVSIGGWGNYDGFSQALADGTRATLVANLVQVMNDWGFDGIDLDMEPIEDSDVANYTAFVEELHAALQGESTPLLATPMLTTATGWQPEMHADLQDEFDQINLMTYDFSGAWSGWVTWHNAPISNGGHTFPSTGEPLPSIEEEVDRFIQAGVAPEKLGIGIDFYGYVWSGVSQPREGWTTAPTVEGNVAYHTIMSDYYASEFYNWDAEAKASYLSITDADPALFVSYDDERAVAEKVAYVRDNHLGGAIIWEIAGGYREGEPASSRHPLLDALEQALQR